MTSISFLGLSWTGWLWIWFIANLTIFVVWQLMKKISDGRRRNNCIGIGLMGGGLLFILPIILATYFGTIPLRGLEAIISVTYLINGVCWFILGVIILDSEPYSGFKDDDYSYEESC